MFRSPKSRLVKQPLSSSRIKNQQTKPSLQRITTLSGLFLFFAAAFAVTTTAGTPTPFSGSIAFQNPKQQPDMRRAWKSKGKNQRELVDQLRKAGIIRTDAVENVMGAVDRGNYCFLRPRFQKESEKICYADRALGIGLGQTISAPHMHAYALEEIYPSVAKALQDNDDGNNNINAKILDVGCGSGYLTACFGRWLSPPPRRPPNADAPPAASTNNAGRVFGIDVRKDLVEMTRKNIERADGDLLKDGVVELSLRDGWKGLPEHAPFDAIHVGAAAETLPKKLAIQLKVGGVLIIPIGPRDSNMNQVLYRIRRVRNSNNNNNSSSSSNVPTEYYSSEDSFCKDDYEIKKLLGVRYVPLVHGEEV